MARINGTTHSDVLDALIVGAGFAGMYQLKHLRNANFKVLLVDSATSYGGVWSANRYPGARVDTQIPLYEFSDPALWQEWLWKQRFPGATELRSYFEFVADKWDLRKDSQFETRVEGANWDNDTETWSVTTSKGSVKARYLLLNVGSTTKRYIPAWPGVDKFKGTLIHSTCWPKTGLDTSDMQGKRIAVIGTGSTGVQITQELSRIASHFTLFQRTPNTALPMRQVEYQGDGHQLRPKEAYSSIFDSRRDSFCGFDYGFLTRGTFDDTPEERLQTYERLWSEGGFQFWLATYHDMLFSSAANDEAYAFWRDKTRARIHSERNKELLAPQVKPHAFGCKRISLETSYFEAFNQENVSLVDVNATPIVEVTENGIRTTEKEWEFDLIVVATGFDSVTGGLLDISLEGMNGQRLGKKWAAGLKTHLGMSANEFPNMFFSYGPQAPTPLCNGPTCAEFQGDWILKLMEFMKEKGLHRVEAETAFEDKWTEDIWTLANASLLPTVKSWYMGDNIPGKNREPLLYVGGVPAYHKAISDCAKDGYAGFTLS